MVNILNWLGDWALTRWRNTRRLASIVLAVLGLSSSLRYLSRPVLNVLVRQVLFTGVEAWRFMAMISLLVGVSIVVQAELWLNKVGQSGLLGPILVVVVVREVAPLLTNFVVIGRSGAAIATELANMRVNGEIELLDAQGLDPMIYLVLPRVWGVAISVFCLTIVFIVVCFASGFVTGVFMGSNTGNPATFIDSVFQALRPADVVNLLAKTFIPGLLTGAICCDQAFNISGAVTEVPQAVTRSLVKSVAALFVTSALVSVLTYL